MQHPTRRGVLIAAGALAATPGAVPAGAAEGRTASGDLVLRRAGSRPRLRAPDDHFTGEAFVDGGFEAEAPGRAAGAMVQFAPGARTAWHTHPLGQTLIVTAGVGWVQRRGGPVEEIRPGDVVSIPSGMEHWHGATATTGMTHVAVAERLDGRSVAWLEKVSDAEYGRGASAAEGPDAGPKDRR